MLLTKIIFLLFGHVSDLNTEQVWIGLWCLMPFLLVEETGVPGKNPLKLDHIMLYRVHLAMNGFRTHNFSGDRQIAQVVVNPTTIRS